MEAINAWNLKAAPMGEFKVDSIECVRHVNHEGEPMPWLSIVLPTFNESENIEKIVFILSNILDSVTDSQYEIIIVDDDSPDKTWEKACRLTKTYSHLKVVRRTNERGLSTAVIRGWQVAQGEVLGVIDADLQHPPEILEEMIRKLNEGADLVVASRHVEGGGVSNWNVTRRFLSRGAQVLGLIVCPAVVGQVSDPMSGYFLVRRSGIADVLMDPLGYKILLEVIGRGNLLKIAEVGYVFQERLSGESKVTWKQYSDYILHLGKLRSRGRIGRFKRKFKFPLVRVSRFCLVGLSGVFIDMLFLFLLSDPSMLALGLTRSKVIAAEAAIVNNFIWNDIWTFRDISSQQKGWRNRLRRFLKFNSICLLGIVLNVLILNILFNIIGLNRYLANLIAIGLVTIWNFWINLKLSWRSASIK